MLSQNIYYMLNRKFERGIYKIEKQKAKTWFCNESCISSHGTEAEFQEPKGSESLIHTVSYWGFWCEEPRSQDSRA